MPTSRSGMRHRILINWDWVGYGALVERGILPRRCTYKYDAPTGQGGRTQWWRCNCRDGAHYQGGAPANRTHPLVKEGAPQLMADMVWGAPDLVWAAKERSKPYLNRASYQKTLAVQNVDLQKKWVKMLDGVSLYSLVHALIPIDLVTDHNNRRTQKTQW